MTTKNEIFRRSFVRKRGCFVAEVFERSLHPLLMLIIGVVEIIFCFELCSYVKKQVNELA
jgi:hypothetical protein